MIITRQKLRALILEQIASNGGARFNKKNNTSWERWVRENDLEEDEEKTIEEEEEVFEQK